MSNPNFETFLMLIEFSAIAVKNRISNEVPSSLLGNAFSLYTRIYSPLREQVADLKINSGFRTKELNQAIPGSSATSSHLQCLALDLSSQSRSAEQLLTLAKSLDSWDQLIFYPDRNFLHVGISTPGRQERRQVLRCLAGKYYPLEF